MIGDIAFEGMFHNKKEALISSALLNSSITFLSVELLDRLNLREGLLTFHGPDINSLLVPNAKKIATKQKEKILGPFYYQI